MYRALAILMMLISCNALQAATSANANSAMGVNLAGLTQDNSELPLLNMFPTNNGWFTSNATTFNTLEGQYLQYDANGWPTSMTPVGDPSPNFTMISVLLFRNVPQAPNIAGGNVYPAGHYIVLYDGQGTLSYNFDAVLVSSAPGRDVINVVPTYGGGIWLRITATDPSHTGNYIRNIRIVKAEYEAALNAGQTFNPTFLALMKNFRVLRFMDWFQTNNNTTLSAWANRPTLLQPSWNNGQTYGAPDYGAPIDLAIKLVNATGADPWLTVPIAATDDYITQMATLVHSQLGASQKAYVELSNEVWNTGFAQYTYANNAGKALWLATYGANGDYENNWYGMRAAQMCDNWKTVWGADAARVVCVLARQAASTYTATQSLACTYWTAGTPCASHGIGAVAIAPYFGGAIPSAWTSQPDGGLTLLFASLTTKNDPTIPTGGFLGQALGWVAAYPPAIASYHLPLISYEGGQTFLGFPTGPNSALTALCIAANRDARMGSAYATYLAGWKTNGGTLLTHFNDIQNASQYGEWGAMESIMQPTVPLSSAPPKWQAIQNFISGTPCWWTGCAGSITQSPPVPPPAVPPTNLNVH